MSGFAEIYDEAYALRVTMVEQLSARVGKRSMELYADVQREFGECGMRRFMRNLSFLVSIGCIIRKDEPGGSARGSVTPYYFPGPAEVPKTRSAWCRVCEVLYGAKILRWVCDSKKEPWNRVPLLAFPVPASRVHAQTPGRRVK